MSVLAIGLYVISCAYPMEIECWIEIGQETLLFLSVFFFALAAARSPVYAGGLYLVAGFFSVCFIRELDAYFDYIFHGAWKAIVILYLPFLIWILKKADFRTVIPGLVHYIRSRSFTMLLPGVVILLAYSRLFGSKALWKHYLPPDIRIGPVKTFSEEATELLGYAIIFGASLVAAHEKNGREQASRKPRLDESAR